jgi:peptidoglycan/LPS O-acetylase OafA/YrhL
VSFQHGNLSIGDQGDNWALGFVRVAFPYGCGMLLYRWWSTAPARRTWHPATLLLLPAAMLVAAWPVLSRSWLLDPLLVTVIFPLALWFGAAARMPARWRGAAAAAGLLSYPLYAFHLPAIELGEVIAAKLGGQGMAAIRLIALLAAVGGAWAWCRYQSAARGQVPRPTARESGPSRLNADTALPSSKP